MRGLVVADDLTGACDTGHEFAARGHRTRVLVGREADADDPDDPEDVDVLVVDTDSRSDPAGEAATAVRAGVESHPAETVYKKVDSTLRGNLAAEVDAALDALGEDAIAVVAPASPATGRTTACGYHLVDGALVTDTEPGRDPETGPASAHLPSLFAAAPHPVEHVGVGTVATGADAVADRLADLGDAPRIVTVDATHDRHLGAVADGARHTGRPTVYVGSAGLAGHVRLATEGTGTGDAHTPTPPEGARGVLGIVGSVAPETLDALAAVPERALVVLNSEEAVEDPDAAALEASERARAAVDAGGQAVVTAATERVAVERTLAAGESFGLSPRETRGRVARTLARTAHRVVTDRQPRGLFLTGGDTAVTVLDTLDARAVDLSGEAVEAGVPLGVVEGGEADGSALVTKAGAFGGERTVVNCLDRLLDA